MEVKRQDSGGRKNIVVIGGSYGGVSITHQLLKHVLPSLPNGKEIRVILISAAATALDRPACPRALISDDFFPQDELFVGIPALFQQYAGSDLFEFRKGTVTHLDHTQRTITAELASGEIIRLPFHAAVIATGAVQQSPLLGFSRDETHLREVWHAFRGALPKAKHIVIAGGGPSAIETAGELGEYLNGRPGLFHSPPKHPKVQVTVVSSATKILPQLRASIARAAEQYLSQVGVTIRKGVGAFMGWRMPSIFVYWLKGRDYWLWTLGDPWSGKQWEKEK